MGRRTNDEVHGDYGGCGRPVGSARGQMAKIAFRGVWGSGMCDWAVNPTDVEGGFRLCMSVGGD